MSKRECLNLLTKVRFLSVCQNNSNYKQEVLELLVELKVLDGMLVNVLLYFSVFLVYLLIIYIQAQIPGDLVAISCCILNEYFIWNFKICFKLQVNR